MSWLTGLANSFVKSFASRVADEVILIIRKRTRLNELDKHANDLKEELKTAQSTAEREAVLEKVHDLINGFGRL